MSWAIQLEHGRRWQVPERLIHDGQLSQPQPILEIQFISAVDQPSSPLRIQRLTLKHGYAPQPEPLDQGYRLSLHAADGVMVSALLFAIPDRVFDPPPEPGQVSDGRPVVFRAAQFSLTIPWKMGAAELRVADPEGIVILAQSVQGLRLQDNAPHFRSREHRSPYQMSRWWRQVDQRAEASTTDGHTLDITFVGDNYGAGDLALFYHDADRIIDHLLTYEPYASRSAQLRFHLVDNTAVDLGCVHNPMNSRLLTCNNTTVMSTINDMAAPYDKIVVLVKDRKYGGSGGTIAVSYNGRNAPEVAVHEFGRSFGGLLDEYNVYTSGGLLDNAAHANCYAGAPPSSSWDGLVEVSGYTRGCRYPNWYRSSTCSIMLNLSCHSFNTVSQRQLESKLDLFTGGPP